jgi:hypothetical protein
MIVIVGSRDESHGNDSETHSGRVLGVARSVVIKCHPMTRAFSVG